MAFRNDDLDADPTANGVGKPGYTDGEPGVTAPTPSRDVDLNMFQEEICRAVELCGNTLVKSDNEQLANLLRRSLAGTQANLAKETDATLGELVPAGTDVFLEALVADPGVIVAVCETDVGANRRFTTSEDGGQSFTVRATLTDTGTVQGMYIVPGLYIFCYSATNLWYSSASPYTSWTEVSSATFTANFAAYKATLATFEGADTLLVVGHGSGVDDLAYTDGTTRPTVAGDWTTLSLTTILRDPQGVATNGVNNVIGGLHSANLTARLLYAPVADGALIGDWTIVDLSTSGTSSTVEDVVWNGHTFVALVSIVGGSDDNEVWTSTDGVTWYMVQSISTNANTTLVRLTADGSGFVLAYGDEATKDRWASRDGIVWFESERVADVNMIASTYSQAQNSFSIDPDTHSVIGATSGSGARFKRSG